MIMKMAILHLMFVEEFLVQLLLLLLTIYFDIHSKDDI